MASDKLNILVFRSYSWLTAMLLPQLKSSQKFPGIIGRGTLSASLILFPSLCEIQLFKVYM